MADGTPGGYGVSPRFDPRHVGLDQAGSLLRETYALIAQSPLRLFAIVFLLSLISLALESTLPFYFGLVARGAVGAIWFTGFYVALESARTGKPPGLRDFEAVLRLDPGKFTLLAIVGSVPMILVLLGWWADWGLDAMVQFTASTGDGTGAPQVMPQREKVLFDVIDDFAQVPFFFVLPLCALYPWNASRTLSGSLIAVARNSNWVLVLTLVTLGIDIGVDVIYDFLAPQSVMSELVRLLVSFFYLFVAIAASAFTLILLQRSLR